jgi:hypothetical protein
MYLSIDNVISAAVGASAAPPLATTEIISREVLTDVLDKLAHARATIAVSFDGWDGASVFPARGTAAAMAALSAACGYDPAQR